MSGCGHFLGTLPCDNPRGHEGGVDGHGCTHTAAWAPDRHTQEASDE